MKEFTKIDLAVGIVAILAIALVTLSLVLPTIKETDGGDLAMILVTSVIAFFAVAQFFLQRRSHKFQKKIQTENQEFERSTREEDKSRQTNKDFSDQRNYRQLKNIQMENQGFEQHLQDINYKLALYERRLKVYLEIEKLIDLFIIKPKPEIKDVNDFVVGLRGSLFILPIKQQKYVGKLITKSAKYVTVSGRIESYNKKLIEGKTLTKEQQKNHDKRDDDLEILSIWFQRQMNEGIPHKKFENILKLPDSLKS